MAILSLNIFHIDAVSSSTRNSIYAISGEEVDVLKLLKEVVSIALLQYHIIWLIIIILNNN